MAAERVSTDSSERFEWLETYRETRAAVSRPREEIRPGRRCPRCQWLDEVDAPECFRCGYSFLSSNYSADYLLGQDIRLPEPKVTIESPGTIFQAGLLDPPQLCLLRHRTEKVTLTPGFSELIAPNYLRILHFPHQEETALRVLQEMHGQGILADEVGLGKTIEAGIIMKELILRGMARRVLILTPAALLEQWQEELREKLREKFVIARKDRDWAADRILASLSYVRQNGARHVENQTFDLLIVDEAHKLKNRATKQYKVVDRMKKKYVLLLTATPFHNDLQELYNLVNLLKPGFLGTIRTFARHFVDVADRRRPVRPEMLKKLLSQVMVRHRRQEVRIRFPERRAAVYHIRQSPEEQQLYDRMTEFIRNEVRERMREIRSSDAPVRYSYIFTLMTLQRELCSSSRALQGSLEKLMGNEEFPPDLRNRFRQFASLAGQVGENRKALAVDEILSRFPGRFLIFTEFTGTVDYLEEFLGRRGHKVLPFTGRMGPGARRKALQEVQGTGRVLLCTPAGSEGLNFQFAQNVINYDLPWNPMAVEQRIGRVHRLGQENDVCVFNLSVHGTIEARILDLLCHKIRMFETVIGELDLILGAIDATKSFEDLLREIWLTSPTEQHLEKRFDALGAQLEEARKEYEHLKESETILSDLMT